MDGSTDKGGGDNRPKGFGGKEGGFDWRQDENWIYTNVCVLGKNLRTQLF